MPKPEERPAARPHDLILESRTTLTVTGVQKVLHCSPESAALETGKGTLHLAGAQLSVVSLDLEAGRSGAHAGAILYDGGYQPLEGNCEIPGSGSF